MLRYLVVTALLTGSLLHAQYDTATVLGNAAGHLEAFNGDNSRVNYRDLASEKGLGSYNQPVNNTSTLSGTSNLATVASGVPRSTVLSTPSWAAGALRVSTP